MSAPDSSFEADSLDDLPVSVDADTIIVKDTNDANKLKEQTKAAFLAGVPSITTESFAAFNARFIGEVGTPSQNIPAWTETVPSKISVSDDNVFGVAKEVVKFIDDSPTSDINVNLPLTVGDWANIFSFGASFGGTLRMDTSVPIGAVFKLFLTDADSATKKRYGVRIRRVGNFVELIQQDNPVTLNIILDGLDGRPLVLYDEWFKLEIVVLPSPATTAEVFINDQKLTQVITFAVTTQNNTEISITSGLISGITSIYYADDYGLTIYTESSTKTISTQSMNSDAFLILIPPGKRDYEIRFPPGITRDKGDRFSILAENTLGNITLTSLPLDPLILYTGLKTLFLETKAVTVTSFINTLDNANNYEFDQPAGAKSFQKDGQLLQASDISYNTVNDVYEGKRADGGVTQFSEEELVPVINNTGATIPNGSVVRASGFDVIVNKVEIVLALADSISNAQILGVTTTELRDGEIGKATRGGGVNELDTTGFTAGNTLFLDPLAPGAFTEDIPDTFISIVGVVGLVDGQLGSICVQIHSTSVEGFAPLNNPTFTGKVTTPALEITTNDIIQKVVTGLVASPAQIQGDVPLEGILNVIATVANPNDVVTLTPAKEGMLRIAVRNNGANVLQIYPAIGDDLGNGVNVSITLQPQQNMVFSSPADGLWIMVSTTALSGVVDISCKVSNTVDQPVADTGFTAITWAVEEYDTDGMHDSGTNPSRITINTPGKYSISVQAEWEDSAQGGERNIGIRKNGVTGDIINFARISRNNGTEHTIHGVEELVAGDFIEVIGSQDSNGDLNFLAFGLASMKTYFEAHKIN